MGFLRQIKKVKRDRQLGGRVQVQLERVMKDVQPEIRKKRLPFIITLRAAGFVGFCKGVGKIAHHLTLVFVDPVANDLDVDTFDQNASILIQLDHRLAAIQLQPFACDDNLVLTDLFIGADHDGFVLHALN
jgi:hypothetical protein